MKTIRQIAEEIGVDKQRVYRYIKKHQLCESHQKCIIGDTVETLIKHHFSNIVTSKNTSGDTIITMLKNELEQKNRFLQHQQQTIRDLTTTIKAQAEILRYRTKYKTHTNCKQAKEKETSIPIKRLIENKNL